MDIQPTNIKAFSFKIKTKTVDFDFNIQAETAEAAAKILYEGLQECLVAITEKYPQKD